MRIYVAYKTTLNFAHTFHFDTYKKISAIFQVSIFGEKTIILQISDYYTGDGLSIGFKNEEMCEFTEKAELHNSKISHNPSILTRMKNSQRFLM